MLMDPLSRLYTILSAFNIKQTLHLSKMAFDCVVLCLIAMFLLGSSSKGLTVVVLWRKGKAQLSECYKIKSSIKKHLIDCEESSSKSVAKDYLTFSEKVPTRQEQRRLPFQDSSLVLCPTRSSNVRFRHYGRCLDHMTPPRFNHQSGSNVAKPPRDQYLCIVPTTTRPPVRSRNSVKI